MSHTALTQSTSIETQNKDQIKSATIVGNYKLEKTIGEGTFGKVKLAIHLPTQEYVAIKILEKAKIHDQEELDRVEKEIKYLKSLSHPNIIQIYENFYLVMEYACGGELFNYIVKNEKITENESSYFFSQLIHGIEEIHKLKICHRDIKPENLLLTEKKILKIIDFGLSNEYDKFLTTPCGSPCYASPEMIHGIKYNGLSVDLWASGIILYAMVCGYLPFDDQDNEKLFAKILECKIEFPSDDETILSSPCKNLIIRILTPNPNKRITLEEIKQHPFMTYGNEKYNSSVTDDNFTHKELILERMTNMFDCKRDEVLLALENNRHNNLTTMYKLFKKKHIEGRFYDGIIIKPQPHPKMNSLQKTSIRKGGNLNNKKKNITTTKTPNYVGSSVSANQSLIDDLDNAISESKAIEQGNIIIINNTNMISRPVKMNALYDKLISNKGKKPYNRKIDTSVSIDKTKRDDGKSKSRTNTPNNSKGNGNNYNTRKINHAKLIEALAKGTIGKRATSDESKRIINEQARKSKFSPDKINIDNLYSKHHYKELKSNDITANKHIHTTTHMISNGNDPYIPTTKKPRHKINRINMNPTNKKDHSPNSHHYNSVHANILTHHSPIKTEGNIHSIIKEKNCFPYQRKPQPSDDLSKSITASNQKKKNHNVNRILLLPNSKSQNFVMCSSQIPKNEIESKLAEYCIDNQLSIFLETGTHINSRYVISIDDNTKFIIEISVVDNLRMLKLYHLLGQEALTKDAIRKIVVNVGF